MPEYPRPKNQTLNPPRAGTLIPPQRGSQPSNQELATVQPTDYGLLTVQDLNNILEVNQKALTIYLEVEKQNEDIIDALGDQKERLGKLDDMEDQNREIAVKQDAILKSQNENNELLKEVKTKMTDLDKSFFRLIIILGSAGIGTIITIIQALLTSKH